MSTNYYIKEKSMLGEKFDHLIHIGLSSYGWCFQLHVIPEKGINNLDDWKKIFKLIDNNKSHIVDEYDRKISYNEMIRIIENRNIDNSNQISSCKKNNAEYELNNLKRSTLDSRCIGHGNGTYDYIVGDFS